MDTHLQESGGLRRTAPVQSPVPVVGGGRLNRFQRVVVGFFVATLALLYLLHLVPQPEAAATETAVPVRSGGIP